MEDGGLTINISVAPVKPIRKQKPTKRGAAPSQLTAPSSSSHGAGLPDAGPARKKRRNLDKSGNETGGAKPRRDAGRPVQSSLFTHNPALPELSLSAAGDCAPDLFSGQRFSELPLHPLLVTTVSRALGGEEMTRVQRDALPTLLSGADCLVRAQTGSGKTLAYLVPVVQTLQALKPPVTRADGLLALVVVPTRELALQTYNTAAGLLKAFVRLVPGYLTGGEKTLAEKRRLRRGLNLLVATPGRLLAHIASTRNLRLGRLRWLVLDEADLLLDMGYERDVRSVVAAIEEQRAAAGADDPLQTVLLSATLDDRVRRLAGLSLHEPKFIDAAVDGEGTVASGASSELVVPGQLRQFVAVVPAKLRMVALAAFVLWKCAAPDEAKMMVFMSTQDMVDYHASLLAACLPARGDAAAELRVLRLHGSMAQQERTAVFSEFRAARRGLLICTDVAARGVDLPRVRWAVQYTPPGRPVDYVHRAGRTARGGGAGSALLILTPAETGLLETLQQAGLSVSHLSLETILATLASGPAAARPGAVEAAATQLQLQMEEAVLGDRQLHAAAVRGFQSLVRAYAAYPAQTRTLLAANSLHLGHYAKALCLRETPTQLGRSRPGPPADWSAARRRPQQQTVDPQRPRVSIPHPTDMAEFQSGLDTKTTHKKKKKKKGGTK